MFCSHGLCTACFSSVIRLRSSRIATPRCGRVCSIFSSLEVNTAQHSRSSAKTTPIPSLESPSRSTLITSSATAVARFAAISGLPAVTSARAAVIRMTHSMLLLTAHSRARGSGAQRNALISIRAHSCAATRAGLARCQSNQSAFPAVTWPSTCYATRPEPLLISTAGRPSTLR